jgi:type III restriction enzyme
MADTLIENPILNSPCLEPSRHFRFSDEGITNGVVAGCRKSSYFIPIAPPKKKGKQLVLENKRVPHVTLKSIANNPDIKGGMTLSRSEAVRFPRWTVEISSGLCSWSQFECNSLPRLGYGNDSRISGP